jgi:hypothetical protein
VPTIEGSGAHYRGSRRPLLGRQVPVIGGSLIGGIRGDGKGVYILFITVVVSGHARECLGLTRAAPGASDRAVAGGLRRYAAAADRGRASAAAAAAAA